MLAYRTTEEKAAQWDITARHVQHLCKNGKIDGAVKRAGAWFIPDDAPIPTKNTKSTTEGFKFVGTKSRIFASAIELFMLKGYNNVSLKDIASRVGIRQSTIYNHFKSKQEILDVIYDYYQYYFRKGRKPIEAMEDTLKNAQPADIINCIRYVFEDEYAQQLLDITKIIFQRISVDERARVLAKTLIIEEGVKYVEEVFNKGIELGRFAPFDTHLLAVFINGIRQFTMLNWLVEPDPSGLIALEADERALYNLAMSYLIDLSRHGN